MFGKSELLFYELFSNFQFGVHCRPQYKWNRTNVTGLDRVIFNHDLVPVCGRNDPDEMGVFNQLTTTCQLM